jgi:hypothetical protein
MAYEATLAAFRRGDNLEAARLARLDLADAVARTDSAAHVDALCMLARVALRAGDLGAVEAHATEAQRVAESIGARSLERMPIHLRAVAARMSGRSREARELFEASSALDDELGETRMAAAEHRNLAYVEIHEGEPGAPESCSQSRAEGWAPWSIRPSPPT